MNFIFQVIRAIENEELSRQIAAMLSQKGYAKIPSRSTILKILSSMPASPSRMMRGINATVEESREAFQTLSGLLKDLAPCAIQTGNYTEEDFENLTDALAAAEKYYKSHFVLNLRKHSKIGSHCLSHALSDEKRDDFSSPCDEEHTDICENCMIVPDLIQVLEGVLQTLKDFDNFPENLSFEEAQFDLHDAHQRILNLKSHLMRNHVSQIQWESLIKEKNPKKAFMTMDWAMKGLPKKFRESTRDWYAQAGWSWQLLAYQRCFSDASDRGQVETNVHCAVLNDHSLQDSQSVLAILKSSLELYKKANPDVEEIYIRSDNAGMLDLISSYSFSEKCLLVT